jgi:glycosyltransferase involved in cell wall biosynthesis
MRIAITVDPEIPVPPRFYGGIERVVGMLVGNLVRRGHEVTLFAHRDSKVPCRLLAYPADKSTGALNIWRNLSHTTRELRRGGYDVVHSFGRLLYLLPMLPLRVPKIMSYQRTITPRSIVAGELLSRGTLQFTACGRHMMRRWQEDEKWHVVANCVAVDAYRAVYDVPPNAPLIYLGRIERIKGVHLAIEVARRSGRRLLIAGNVSAGAQHQRYFQQEIEPHVGRDTEYLGPLDDRGKNELLGGAAALLMPILWDEPFGIVMAEALACGTPVIGLRRGSVPEIVEDGVNGFACDSLEEMAAAVGRISTIDRRTCRAICEQRFGADAITDAYLRLYSAVIDSRAGAVRLKGEKVCGSA